MSNIDENLVFALERTAVDNQYFFGVEVLLKLLDNIIKEPSNQKYRMIRLENETIRNKLLPLNGVNELLINMGFELTNNCYTLPSTVLLAKLKKYREFIAKRLDVRKKCIPTPLPSVSKSLSSDAKPSTSTFGLNSLQSNKSMKSKNVKKDKNSTLPKLIASKSFQERISFPTVLNTRNPFLRLIEEHSDLVMQYIDKNLQEYALKLIPIERLKLNAINKLRNIQKDIKNAKLLIDIEPCLNDLILVELLNWFNTEFFEWINVIPCKICNKDGNTNSITTIKSINNIRVEVNVCCNKETKFYRYNDIEKLLQTRKGRCGEYANCFTFLCYTLGYDSRLVCSQFDHVWTEVYSSSQKRWLHIDPSENVIDSPLMYQHGWKRTIDYIIAYSIDDVQDVTWRYTSSHKNTVKLRNMCNENELIHTIISLRRKRSINISKCRQSYLLKRCTLELVQLMIEREPNENEQKGRSSGSLVWKRDRGEIVEDNINFFEFKLHRDEIQAKQFNLRYSCAFDKYEKYIRHTDGNEKLTWEKQGWYNCNYLSKNIFRKIEKDWKMVYLARKEETDYAEIIWNFNFSDTNLSIKNYTLKFDTKTYENGKILINIINNSKLITDKNVNDNINSNKIINNSSNNDCVKDNIIGSNSFKIHVKLMGGKGDIAWQHTQLFRQSINSFDYPFELNINFN